MKILAVALLDHEVMGRDIFMIEESPDRVVQYEVHTSGRVEAISPPLPKISIDASIEKFNHGYLLEAPVEVGGLSELAGYLGRFEAVDSTNARLLN